MAMRTAKVLYDFSAEAGSGEISVREGELVTITRTDIGEGWWEGTSVRGETGLFPEAYVEEIFEDSAPPPMAPPPLPQQDYNAPAPGQNTFGMDSPLDDWTKDPWSAPPQQAQPAKPQQQNDWNDDDFDSDFDDDSASQHGNQQQNQNALAIPSSSNNLSGSTGDVSSIGREGKKVSATSKTSFNRFSPFVKTGAENFILGKVHATVPPAEIVSIVELSDKKYIWESLSPPYSCTVASPKKDSKFKGLKSFIAYQLTPSFNNIQVSRRYKHFDWLHERLNAKFTYIAIPPLPDKQIQGRYEEEFIEHRMNQLQSFVDRMCRHPVLSQSEVWKHFLTCTDEKRWKSGKRKAEKDPLVGGANLLALKPPEKALDPEFVFTETMVFSEFSSSLDLAIKNLAKVSADMTHKAQNDYKRDYQTISKAFLQLSQALENQEDKFSGTLNEAILQTSKAYEDISSLIDEQPRLDWEHYADMMHDYKGMLSGFPQILQIHQGCQNKYREVDADSKLGPADIAAVKHRTEAVSFALLAEMHTFQQQLAKDMKIAHQKFLREQIDYHRKVADKLEENLRLYDQC
eukprot:TRINITY_DN7264_c0_g1_i2.p1 TRINITY_DN7264_c0_g1~~TRINITY_DN7264_c0_g1_i2.p1  ORF type:complete len:580 (+),score=112.09 TRINITY_DN7264_c0_g1_i2:24-1742(+)